MSVNILSKLLVFSFVVVVLGGCNSVKELSVSSIEKPRLTLTIENPTPVHMKVVEWVIITPENYESVFGKMKNDKFDVVLFGLTDEGYQNLSVNFKALRTFIIEQNSIIQSYKQYYK